MAYSPCCDDSLWSKIVFVPESKISIVFSLSIIVSLSKTISFLSIETTSPVSSSTKSSCHVFNTSAANLRPKTFLNQTLKL